MPWLRQQEHENLRGLAVIELAKADAGIGDQGHRRIIDVVPTFLVSQRRCCSREARDEFPRYGKRGVIVGLIILILLLVSAGIYWGVNTSFPNGATGANLDVPDTGIAIPSAGPGSGNGANENAPVGKTMDFLPSIKSPNSRLSD